MPNGPEDNPPPSGRGGAGRPPPGAGGAGGPTRVEVTRIDQQTGHTIDTHADLLREIRECCEEQTKTLGKHLDEIKNSILQDVKVSQRIKESGEKEAQTTSKLAQDIGVEFNKHLSEQFKIAITQLKAAPAAPIAGEAGEAATDLAESFGATAAATRTARDRFDDINDILQEATPQLAEWNKLFSKGVIREIEQMMRELNVSMMSLATTLRRDATRFLKESFMEGMELSRTGLVNLHEVFIDTAGAIAEQRDNIVLTMKSMQAAIEKGLVPPLGTFGTSIKEVGKSFADLRDEIDVEGFRFASAFKNLEDANVALQTLVSSDLRAGVKSDIRDSETQKRFAFQLEELRLIGQLSGKQLEEMINQRQQTNKEFDLFVKQGLISKEDADQAKLLYDFFVSQGQQEAADNLKMLVETGAMKDGLSTAMAAMNEEQRTLSALNRPIQQGMIDLVKHTRGVEELAVGLHDVNTQIAGQGQEAVIQQKLGTKLAASIATAVDVANAKDLAGVMKSIKDAADTAAGQADDQIRTVQFILQKFITPALWSLVATTGVIAARMLLGGAGQLFRFLRRGRGGAGIPPGGVPRTITAATRTAIPVAGATPGVASMAPRAAGILGRGAGFLGRLVPGLGTAISGGLALRSFAQGDILGGLLHGGASVASIFPGVGTAVAAGLEGLALGREFLGPAAPVAPGVGPTPAPTPAVTPTPGSPQKMLLEHMVAQTNHLSRLVMLAESSNTIGGEIRDRIGRPERAAFAREGGATEVGAAPYGPPLNR